MSELPQTDDETKSADSAAENGHKPDPFWTMAAFIAPLLVYLGLGYFEPDSSGRDVSANVTTKNSTTNSEVAGENSATDSPALPASTSPETTKVDEADYSLPLFFSARIAATLLVLLPFVATYRQLLWTISWEAVVVGIVGVIAWIAICQTRIEFHVAHMIGLGDWLDSTQRSQIDPWTLFSESGSLLAGFIAVRFVALAVVVPIAEELFLRGFLLRFFVQDSWWSVSLKEIPGNKAYLIASAYAVLTHPGEIVAAIVWFSMVTWLMKRRGSMLDCVTAHAVTNALLGIYVLAYGQWQLW